MTVLGIDLGATCIHVAVARDGEALSVPSRTGRDAIPAVVTETGKGRLLAGELAKRQAIVNADCTISGPRRLLGRDWDVDDAADLRRATGCSFVAGPKGDLRIALPKKIYTPQEIVAASLEEARKAAEAQVGRVTEAAVAVPPHFDARRRAALREAAAYAGLEVLDLVEEPVAAAIAHDLDEVRDATVAIYDLGGSSFNFSILATDGSGLFRLLYASSETAFGGTRIDAWIVGLMAEVLEREHSLSPRSDAMSLQRLFDAAEGAKRRLTDDDETKVSLRFQPADGGEDDEEACQLVFRMTRRQLAAEWIGMVRDTMDHCERALSELGLSPESLGEVGLAGGMSAVPWVRSALRELFLRPPRAEVAPDAAIAIGAAIHAHRVASGQPSGLARPPSLPRGLGLLVGGEGADELFPRGTALPASVSRTFTTGRDGQRVLELVLVWTDGDGPDREVHRRLEVQGIRPAPKGEVDVEVTFALDSGGDVAVSAADARTGKPYDVGS